MAYFKQMCDSAIAQNYVNLCHQITYQITQKSNGTLKGDRLMSFRKGTKKTITVMNSTGYLRIQRHNWETE